MEQELAGEAARSLEGPIVQAVFSMPLDEVLSDDLVC